MLEIIRELNSLWEPVFPHLANFVAAIFRRKTGIVAEAGPFCGVIYELSRRGMGDEFYILSFPSGLEELYEREIKERGLKKIRVIPTDDSFQNVEKHFDLIFLRGAFFFPSIFKLDLLSIYRLLKEGGVAILGGGFGRDTPSQLIDSLRKRSKILNERLGKIEISEKEIDSLLENLGLKGDSTIVLEGGIWVLLTKRSP
jgi:SAM-dependent methyltransferase